MEKFGILCFAGVIEGVVDWLAAANSLEPAVVQVVSLSNQVSAVSLALAHGPSRVLCLGTSRRDCVGLEQASLLQAISQRVALLWTRSIGARRLEYEDSAERSCFLSSDVSGEWQIVPLSFLFI